MCWLYTHFKVKKHIRMLKKYMYVYVLVHFTTYFVGASHKIVLLQWSRWLVWKKAKKDEHSIWNYWNRVLFWLKKTDFKIVIVILCYYSWVSFRYNLKTLCVVLLLPLCDKKLLILTKQFSLLIIVSEVIILFIHQYRYCSGCFLVR